MKTVIGIVSTLLIGCAGAPGEELELDDVEQPTICGSTNDAQHVNHYNGALGPTVGFVQTHKTSKGALETIADPAADPKYCSGTLIAADLFLTAGHCVGSSTIGDFVAFNYELVAGGTTVAAQSHFQVTQILEDNISSVDYAIVRLSGNPGNTFGIAAVAAGDPPVGSAITIIGHPEGEPKQIEAGTVGSYSGNYMRYGNVDTLGGSSGSGVLDNAGAIVAVHTNGGCGATSGTNSGPRIARIREVSGIL